MIQIRDQQTYLSKTVYTQSLWKEEIQEKEKKKEGELLWKEEFENESREKK